MRNICNWKTLAVIGAMFIGMMTLNVATAATLTEKEHNMLGTWLTDAEQRPAIRAEYWKDVAYGVSELSKTLPIPLTDTVVMTGIQWDGHETINYQYIIADPTMDFVDVKRQLSQDLCNDQQAAMFLTIFDGRLNYKHFLVSNPGVIHAEFDITIADCGGV